MVTQGTVRWGGRYRLARVKKVVDQKIGSTTGPVSRALHREGQVLRHAARKPSPRNPEKENERLLLYVTKQDDGHWIPRTGSCGTIVRYRGEMHRLLRALYIAERGAIPAGRKVISTCFLKECCNPHHAELRGNKIRKERTALTREQAQDIYDFYTTGNIRQSELARDFGVDISTIYKIIVGLTWPGIVRESGKKEETDDHAAPVPATASV